MSNVTAAQVVAGIQDSIAYQISMIDYRYGDMIVEGLRDEYDRVTRSLAVWASGDRQVTVSVVDTEEGRDLVEIITTPTIDHGVQDLDVFDTGMIHEAQGVTVIFTW